MDLTVEMWPVERLVPYARNPRKNDEQVEGHELLNSTIS